MRATTRDNKHRIMDLAEDCCLLSDPDVCMDAQSTLTRPKSRISAEIAWFPGVSPEHVDSLLKQLDSPHQNLFNISDLPSLALTNFRIEVFKRLPNTQSIDLINGILKISHSCERIADEEVRVIINEERMISGFPQIRDLSVIIDEILKQKEYFAKTLYSVINNLSVTERADLLTSILETLTGEYNTRYPLLIVDLIQLYEVKVKTDLEKKQRIIEAQVKKLRAMVKSNIPDTELQPIVNQLCQTVRDWGTITQPILLSKSSRGERHNVSSDIVQLLRLLAADLTVKNGKYDFSRQILNTLNDVFAEMSEVIETIIEDLKDLERFEKNEKFNIQVEKLNEQIGKLIEAADAKKPDYILSPIVDELLQTVKKWDVSAQPFEANEIVALSVRGVALHFWNEHQKLQFAIMITNNLIDVFSSVPEIAKRLAEDKKVLDENAKKAKGNKKFEEIKSHTKKIEEAADTNNSNYILYPMVRELIDTVETWESYTHYTDLNVAVAYDVRKLALNLWNIHHELDFAIQITEALVALFRGVRGMDEINDALNRDLITLYSIKEQREKRGKGCLLQIIIFSFLSILVAILQGC